jgi:hypothetical protein
MALPQNRPADELPIYARTTSIGATPAAGSTVAVKKGTLTRAFAFSEGASSGTITVDVAINDVSAGTFSFTGDTDATGSGDFNAAVSEGDVVTFTPSGGSGATIPGHFYALIR